MSASKIIYLQVTDTDYDLGGEFTWCQDKINDEDIEYIRMEEYITLRSENERLNKAVDAAHGTMAVISNYSNNKLSVFDMMKIAKDWLNEYIKEQK